MKRTYGEEIFGVYFHEMTGECVCGRKRSLFLISGVSTIS